MNPGADSSHAQSDDAATQARLRRLEESLMESQHDADTLGEQVATLQQQMRTLARRVGELERGLLGADGSRASDGPPAGDEP